MDELKLCFIKYVGMNVNDVNTYEFLFSDNIDEFWGENFEYMPCCLCNELTPNEDSYSEVIQVNTPIKLSIIQNSCCFSYQDAIDHIVAIAYEDISEYDEYPEDGRLVFFFGDTLTDVKNKLKNKGVNLKNKS